MKDGGLWGKTRVDTWIFVSAKQMAQSHLFAVSEGLSHGRLGKHVTSWAVLDACCACKFHHLISHPWFLYRPRMGLLSFLCGIWPGLSCCSLCSCHKGQGSITQQLFHLVTFHLLREAVRQHGFSFHPYGVAGCIFWYMISIKGISILLSTSTPQDLTQIAHSRLLLASCLQPFQHLLDAGELPGLCSQ